MIDRINIKNGIEFNLYGELDCSKMLPGSYRITTALDIFNIKVFEIISPLLCFDIVDTGSSSSFYGDTDNGFISSLFNWKI